MTDRIRIFSNGTQFADWQASNCERCKKWAGWDKEQTCEIDIALGEAYFDDGTVSQEIAARAGYSADRYGWRCGEAEWTEDWIAERKREIGVVNKETSIKRIIKHFIKYHPTMTFELIPEYPFFREIERLTEDDKKQLKNAFSGFDFGKITRVNLEEKEEK